MGTAYKALAVLMEKWSTGIPMTANQILKNTLLFMFSKSNYIIWVYGQRCVKHCCCQ